MMFVRLSLVSVLLLFGLSWLVDPRLVYGASILFTTNVAVTLWLESETDGEYKKTIMSTSIRLVAYVILGVMSVTFAWMMRGVPGLNKGVFGFMAGIEFLVALFKLSRITPRLRPLYRWVATKFDQSLPFDVSPKQVKEAANES